MDSLPDWTTKASNGDYQAKVAQTWELPKSGHNLSKTEPKITKSGEFLTHTVRPRVHNNKSNKHTIQQNQGEFSKSKQKKITKSTQKSKIKGNFNHTNQVHNRESGRHFHTSRDQVMTSSLGTSYPSKSINLKHDNVIPLCGCTPWSFTDSYRRKPVHADQKIPCPGQKARGSNGANGHACRGSITDK